MKEIITVLISKEEIDEKINEIAAAIENDYAGKELVIVCILMGGMIFMSDLSRKIRRTTILFERLIASSYGMDTETSGSVAIKLYPEQSLADKNVLIVEDIVDTGRSIDYVIRYINTQKPKSLKICTLLNKPYKRAVHGLKIDYMGFVIENHFVVGYGMDCAGKYRNLPYIGILETSENIK